MPESKFYLFLRPVIPKGLRPVFLKYQQYISYLVFGGLTTVVNFAVYYPLEGVAGYLTANVIAWIAAVVFAYIVNKLFVFESNSRNLSVLVYEILTFFAARLLSLGLEELVLYLLVEQAQFNSRIVKIFAQILVIVFNYFASKFVIFRKKK